MATGNRRSVPPAAPAAEQVDDERYADEEEPLRGNVVDPLEEKRDQSQRPARARVRPAGRAPQDHQESRSAAEARQREALDDEMNISAEYNGVNFVFDPAKFTIRFQYISEKGRPVHALEGVIGEEQLEDILDWPVAELQSLTQHLAKAAGLGN